MDTHYHLVVETPLPNVSRGMRQLNGLYAQRFNQRHGRCGHVFQARYRSILVEQDTHLLAVCRYVVLNPVRAGICAEPGAYRWSSYGVTAGETSADAFVATDWIFGHFRATRRVAEAGYRAFVAAEPSQALSEHVRGERLGSDAFLRESFGHDPPLPEIPRVQLEPCPPPLAEIFGWIRDKPVATAYRRYGYTLREIAEYLDCHYSTVSRRLRREEAMHECKT